VVSSITTLEEVRKRANLNKNLSVKRTAKELESIKKDPRSSVSALGVRSRKLSNGFKDQS
jgi:hypothetical protein